MVMRLCIALLLVLPTSGYTTCYSNSSEAVICDGQHISNSSLEVNYDYLAVLHKQRCERLYVKNYILPVFIINHYSSTLDLLNASYNEIRTVIFVANSDVQSNLRRLILESNHLQRFHSDTISLPSSLKILSLANNELEIFDARILSNVRNLTQLDLRNNRLKRILPVLLLRTNIHLDNNPLDCQCTPEFYRIVCDASTNLTPYPSDTNKCISPHYDTHKHDVQQVSYLRFSTFQLICPISAYPPPIIIWSTPVGILSSTEPAMIDLLASFNQTIIHKKLTVSVGPMTARTRHILQVFQADHLSITQARASFRLQVYCSAINMLGSYTHKFDFHIETHAKSHMLRYFVYTGIFACVMSAIGILLCVIFKLTLFYPIDHSKTPPVYPTMVTNSASRTPPNFELNQWLSSTAANITGTLEQVRDILRSGVLQVGGTIRHAAGVSSGKIQWLSAATQQRLNFIRVHTLSSLRNPAQIMRSGLHHITSHINSLPDYCGVTTGRFESRDNLLQQQQFHCLQHSPLAMRINYRENPARIENDDESLVESSTIANHHGISPFAGWIPSEVSRTRSVVGQLNDHANTVLPALNNFNQDHGDTTDEQGLIVDGFTVGGVGTFHGQAAVIDGQQIEESERLINNKV